MKVPLDEAYFVWLYSQVLDVGERNPSRTYWKLLKILYTTEFLWFIPNDDNRVSDGRYLRYEFMDTEGVDEKDDNWMRLNCSVLEMLIGLSRRLSDNSFEGEPPGIWFWKLLENLGLEIFNDNSPPDHGYIKEVLYKVIFRTYRQNGYGGLFPLRHAREDQTKVEIWYQMNAYLQEAS